MNRPLISVRNAKKAYTMGEDLLWALQGIDLDIERGEFVAVMGPSGSGKSTLMNLLGCLDTITEGCILLDNIEISARSRNDLANIRNRNIGFVFQQFNLLPRTSTVDNVMLPLLYSDVPEEEWRQRALDCLEQVGLSDKLNNHPAQLSGGQQQRVAIARALVNQPVLILADEPTGALDTQTGNEVMALFQELNRQGKTIILVTHEEEIANYAKRQLMFREGQLISDTINHEPVGNTREASCD